MKLSLLQVLLGLERHFGARRAAVNQSAVCLSLAVLCCTVCRSLLNVERKFWYLTRIVFS